MPILVEAGWGGLVQYPWSITWTDITDRVDMVQGVAITRGASDERSETQPGSATLTLDNADGALTPGNPNSPYYPYVRKNSPIRVSMAVMPARTGAAPWPLSQMGDSFDSTSGLWASFTGGASVTGGRARIPLTPGVTSTMVSARQWKLPGASVCARLTTVPTSNGSSVSRSNFFVESTTAGTRLGWQHNVSTGKLRAVNLVGDVDGAPTDLDFSAIDHRWMRIRETSGLVYWETSPDGWDWTVRRTLATPAWVTSQSLVVSLNATRTGGTGDYAEWDLLGAQVRPRFYGMVNEWPVEWEGLYSKVTISATDLFKRLNRLPELRSMLGMEVLTSDTLTGLYSFLAAYYPLSEDAGSTSAGSVAGGSAGALAVTQVGAGGTLEFGTDGVPETGETAVTFTPASSAAGKYLVADLGPQTASDTTTWMPMLEVWFKTSTVSRAICGLYEQGLDHELAFVLNASGVLQIEHTESGEPRVITATSTGNLANDTWHHLVYDGSLLRIYVDGVAVGGSLAVTSSQNLRYLHVGLPGREALHRADRPRCPARGAGPGGDGVCRELRGVHRVLRGVRGLAGRAPRPVCRPVVGDDPRVHARPGRIPGSGRVGGGGPAAGGRGHRVGAPVCGAGLLRVGVPVAGCPVQPGPGRRGVHHLVCRSGAGAAAGRR